MKYAMILVIMTALLVGISSGQFGTEQVNPPSWSTFGIFDEGYVSLDLAAAFYAQPFQWIEINPRPIVVTPYVPQLEWEPVPLVMPDPLPISKEDLLGTLTTISPGKQALLQLYT